MLKQLKILGLAALLAGEAAPVLASSGGEGGGEGAAPAHGPQYVEIQPAVLVNYGGPGRIKYLKLEMAVRVADGSIVEHVKHHMPLIRNNLILLFSKQTEEAVGSVEGKEAMRQAALEEVRKVLEEEENITTFTPPPPEEGDKEKEKEKEKEKPKAKDKKGHDDKKNGHGKAETPAVEDLLFNNFIIQR